MTCHDDDRKDETQTCRACGWQGVGRDLTPGEALADLFEACCPNCGEKVPIVSCPTIEESRHHRDKVSPADRIAVELAKLRRRDSERRQWRTTEQLPDLKGHDPILVRDRDGRDHVIGYGAPVLWREPGYYEDCGRFAVVAEILYAKYGPRLQDLVPTRTSYDSLYGDRIGAPARIEKFRERLGQRRHTQ